MTPPETTQSPISLRWNGIQRTLYGIEQKFSLKRSTLGSPISSYPFPTTPRAFWERLREVFIFEVYPSTTPTNASRGRQILLNMRQLLAEADRLMLKKADE
jgi:hypothetical protein